jgi:hypothetical protein
MAQFRPSVRILRLSQCTRGERAISKIDIWRAANLLIRLRGATAVSEATRLAGRMLDRGDSGGWQAWARVRLAIEALQAPRRGELN